MSTEQKDNFTCINESEGGCSNKECARVGLCIAAHNKLMAFEHAGVRDAALKLAGLPPAFIPASPEAPKGVLTDVPIRAFPVNDVDGFKGSCCHEDELRSLERRLASARAEVELARQINAGHSTLLEANRAQLEKLYAQLASANAERITVEDKLRIERAHQESLRSDLAKANAAVEELAIRHCNVARLLGISFLDHDHAWISKEIESDISALRAPVAPSERAVKAAEAVIAKCGDDLTKWKPENAEQYRKEITAIIQRTCFPSGGEGPGEEDGPWSPGWKERSEPAGEVRDAPPLRRAARARRTNPTMSKT